MRDNNSPPEVRQFGRTLRRWRTQIAAWHDLSPFSQDDLHTVAADPSGRTPQALGYMTPSAKFSES